MVRFILTGGAVHSRHAGPEGAHLRDATRVRLPLLIPGVEEAWIGTRLYASNECAVEPWRKERIAAASEDDTVWTLACDRVLGLPFSPVGIGSRGLRTEFTQTWRSGGDEIAARLGDRPRELIQTGRARPKLASRASSSMRCPGMTRAELGV